MSLPNTTYDTATILNPSSDLTDFTLLIDLSRMSSEWWAAVNTSDATKGRAAKNDMTELATDWIDFDDTGETGWLRVKWSGTLSSSGTQILRVYPPVSTNSSYSSSDTYGSDNAYSSNFLIYYPDAGGGDRTANGNDALSYVGGITAGGTAGKTGSATEWDGSDDSIYIPKLLSGATAVTIMVWINVQTTGDSGILWVGTHAGGRPFGFWHDYEPHPTNDRLAYLITNSLGTQTGPGTTLYSNGNVSRNVWNHVCITFNASDSPSPSVRLYINGAHDKTDFHSSAITEIATTTLDHGLGSVGPSGNLMDGSMCEFFLSSSPIHDDYINLEYEQGNDQSNFWGTWANNPPSKKIHFIM